MNTQLRKIRADLRKSLDEKIQRVESKREKIDKLYLPEFSVMPQATLDVFNDMDLYFPYDPIIIKEVREAMEADEWFEHDMLQDSQLICYHKNGISIDARFSINHEDSTCVKTKIGEKEQTVSIYEISCKEGAEEKTFIHKEVKENE